MARKSLEPKAAIRELQDATSGRSGVVLAEGWQTVAGRYNGRPALLVQHYMGGLWKTVAAVTDAGQWVQLG